MSENSWASALQTAPIVSDFEGLTSGVGGAATSASASGSSIATRSADEVGELVFADLQLVAVLEAVRVDALAVHVGAVQRPRVVEEPAALAVHQHGVVARDRHVVEE